MYCTETFKRKCYPKISCAFPVPHDDARSLEVRYVLKHLLMKERIVDRCTV